MLLIRASIDGIWHKVLSRTASKMMVRNRYPCNMNDGLSDFACSKAERAHSTRLVANDDTEADNEGFWALDSGFMAQ
jgi:hypothetical protein